MPRLRTLHKSGVGVIAGLIFDSCLDELVLGQRCEAGDAPCHCKRARGQLQAAASIAPVEFTLQPDRRGCTCPLAGTGPA